MVFFAPAAMWAAFMLVVALLGCWEWSRMSALPRNAQAIYLALSGATGGALWLAYVRAPDYFMTAASFSFIVAALFWIVLAPLWLANKARPSPLVCAIA